MSYKHRILAETPMHIGDDSEEWADLPYVGPEWTSTFDLPVIGPGAPSLLIHHRLIDGNQNEVVINGSAFKLNPSYADPSGRMEGFSLPSGVLRAFNNTVTVRSLDASGTSTGRLDDFVVNVVAIFYPVRSFVAYADEDEVLVAA